ncbi:hypothetical protein N7E81_07665 [Reichenbachiella carrageenanivorans]|uniref:Uncharacterized protein n=1 Tax=Reichenbachiella carrageenanivorans TaxID=2979869 RepID=A0ABY6D589_9BACT|nr:hypothetical protein [Reichenbachiella carrageenanivorans]UXX80974.1 hypothetical protein N7E81_07665 [Reichenbachiella carrageenanivorans]
MKISKQYLLGAMLVFLIVSNQLVHAKKHFTEDRLELSKVSVMFEYKSDGNRRLLFLTWSESIAIEKVMAITIAGLDLGVVYEGDKKKSKRTTIDITKLPKGPHMYKFFLSDGRVLNEIFNEVEH